MSERNKPGTRFGSWLVIIIAAVAIYFLFGDQVGLKKPNQPVQPQPGNSALDNSSYPISLSIASGSENRELEPLLERFVKENKISLDMRYQGSIDIARSLDQDTVPWDAVWPASSLWIPMGDTGHKVKHMESVSTTPVVFGVRQSLAKELGFTDKPVSVRDILDKIKLGELKFCMTSATQSNSGASAYMGFLYALLNNPDILTQQQLEDPALQQDIKALLSGVDRSSGSSEWLKTLFLEGDFDAMVNYESLILTTNQELIKQGREPLHIVYPYDGLSISDAPLGYVDQGNKQKEEAFLKLKDFLMSEEIQKEIQAYGRRTGYSGIDPTYQSVWNKAWGADTDIILSPIRMPDSATIWQALNLYQSEFRKPSLTAYVLDYSGSMGGTPIQDLKNAMAEILLQDRAAKNLLQASAQEENIVILFDDEIMARETASGSKNIEQLYTTVNRHNARGGTGLYEALVDAMTALTQYDLTQYTPAIILMTDGSANGRMGYAEFLRAYQGQEDKIPVFCIAFGNADMKALNDIAELTRSRVFDGKKDLIDAFRKAKGYN